MLRAVRGAIGAAALLGSAAAAGVTAQAPNGFHVSSEAQVPVSPERAFAAFVRVGDWWSSAHTYSGSARNLRLDAHAEACFCESVPGGGGEVEHGRVLYVRPGAEIRLQSALGPLQSEAAVGIWDVTFTPDGAGGTRIRQSYRVGGYSPEAWGGSQPSSTRCSASS